MTLFDGYYRIEIAWSPEKSDWCSDNLEMFDWKVVLGHYFFKKKEDATMFKLMWLE